jgi:hypothetical protein
VGESLVVMVQKAVPLFCRLSGRRDRERSHGEDPPGRADPHVRRSVKDFRPARIALRIEI